MISLNIVRKPGLFGALLFGGILVIQGGGKDIAQTDWIKASEAGLTFEIPGSWQTQSMGEMKVWFLGDLNTPEAAFAVITGEAVAELIAEAPVTSKREILVDGVKGTYHSVFDPSDTSTGFIITFEGFEAAVLGACGLQDNWSRHQATFDRIVGSLRFHGGGGAAAGCDWQSFTPDPQAFAGQPGGVFPMREEYDPGSYLVHIGEAGKTGTDTPQRIKTYGPFDLAAGSNYRALINDDGDIPGRPDSSSTPYLKWEKDPAGLMLYSKPVGGKARIYVRNEVAGEMFYALCLERVEGGTVK